MMTLSAALKLAIDHIEHQAKFITANTVGYSFESLGEDMPGMRAALTRAACKHCDGRGIYESRDIKTFQLVEVECLFCIPQPLTPTRNK